MTTNDDALLAAVLRRILTDEHAYVRDVDGMLHLDGEVGLDTDEAAAVDRVLDAHRTTRREEARKHVLRLAKLGRLVSEQRVPMGLNESGLTVRLTTMQANAVHTLAEEGVLRLVPAPGYPNGYYGADTLERPLP